MNASLRLSVILGLFAAMACGLTALGADDPAAVKKDETKAKDNAYSTKGKLDEVTVYRGQALVTRLIEVPGPAGLREIVVTELPEHVQPASIYAESADGVEVRSVLYRIRPVEQDVREEVRKLDTDIRGVQDLIQTNNQQSQLLANEIGYLAKLEQFTAPTANAELTKGVLNAETLKVLTSFIFEQRRRISDEQLKLSFELRGLNDKLNTLNRQREVLTGGSAKTIHEAVVFVNLKEANGKLRLRDLVDGANWTPSYNARTDSKHQQVTVEYNASIEQMSGEDWDNVTMILSTATPSLVAKAPVLEQLTIALGAAPEAALAGVKGSASAYLQAKKDIEEKRRQIEMNRNFNGSNSIQFGSLANSAGGISAANSAAMPQVAQQPGQTTPPTDLQQQLMLQTGDFDATLNEVARESQVLDLVLTAKVDRATKSAATQMRKGLASAIS